MDNCLTDEQVHIILNWYEMVAYEHGEKYTSEEEKKLLQKLKEMLKKPTQ